jgi:hypothetical protein
MWSQLVAASFGIAIPSGQLAQKGRINKKVFSIKLKE